VRPHAFVLFLCARPPARRAGHEDCERGPAEGAMNQISFSLKRAFRLSVEVGFRVMRKFGLTPSRLEVLLVMDSRAGRTWRQSDLRRRLGVNRTTVSRFVRALAAAGLVHRVRHHMDARTWGICFTEEGRLCLRQVKDALFEQGFAQLLSDTMCFVTPEHREERQGRYALANWDRRLPRPLEPTRQNLERVMRPLELIRESLGDTATLLYPWRRRRRRAPSMLSVLLSPKNVTERVAVEGPPG
jgi:DNA-binding MarR family transcriptional regulator